MSIPPVEKIMLGEDQSRLTSRHAGKPHPPPKGAYTVGGCSQISTEDGRSIASAVVCLRMPGFIQVSGSFAVAKTDVEYTPTYLAYREGPALVKALDILPDRPDVLLVPASGRDHPREMGMARHVGCVLSLPTIGVTRRALHGQSPEEVRSRGGGSIYVSRGWGMDLASALRVVRGSMGSHRMPEPLFIAKRICRRLR